MKFCSVHESTRNERGLHCANVKQDASIGEKLNENRYCEQQAGFDLDSACSNQKRKRFLSLWFKYKLNIQLKKRNQIWIKTKKKIEDSHAV